jgi:hypothetical protein
MQVVSLSLRKWEVGGERPWGRGLGDGQHGQPMLRQKGTRTELHLAAGARYTSGARVAPPTCTPPRWLGVVI